MDAAVFFGDPVFWPLRSIERNIIVKQGAVSEQKGEGSGNVTRNT
jgi:hypothetical protein